MKIEDFERFTAEGYNRIPIVHEVLAVPAQEKSSANQTIVEEDFVSEFGREKHEQAVQRFKEYTRASWRELIFICWQLCSSSVCKNCGTD